MFQTDTNCYAVCDITRKLKANTTYTACAEHNFTGTYLSYGFRVCLNSSWNAVSNKDLFTFTTDDTGITQIAFYVGLPYTIEGDILTLSNIRLYEGTYTKETMPEYEAYGESPTPDYPSEIKNVTGNVTIDVFGKNILPTDISKYNIIDGTYGYYKLIESPQNITISVKDKDTTVDVTNIFFGLTVNGKNDTEGLRWCLSKGELKNVNITGSEYMYFSFYPRNRTTFNKIFQRFDIQVEIGDTATDYEAHKEQVVTFPLEEETLMEGSYLANDGIHHIRDKYVLPEVIGLNAGTGVLENLDYGIWKLPNMNYNSIWHVDFVSNKILGEMPSVNSKAYRGYQVADSLVVLANKNETLESFNSKIAGALVEYKLKEEIIIPYTTEQQKAWNELKSIMTYKGTTHIKVTADSVKPILKLNYKKAIL